MKLLGAQVKSRRRFLPRLIVSKMFYTQFWFWWYGCDFRKQMLRSRQYWVNLCCHDRPQHYPHQALLMILANGYNPEGVKNSASGSVFYQMNKNKRKVTTGEELGTNLTTIDRKCIEEDCIRRILIATTIKVGCWMGCAHTLLERGGARHPHELDSILKRLTDPVI